MNRFFLGSFVVAVAVFALSNNLFAQLNTISASRANDGNGNITSTMVLNEGELFIWNAEIAEMLNSEPEQQDDIRQVLENYWEPFNPENPRTRTEQMTLIDTMREGIYQALTPEQRITFGEITFQLSGGLDALFPTGRTLEILELTAEQKDGIRQIVEERTQEYNIELGKMANDFRGGDAFAKRREFELNFANSESNKKYADRIKAFLTPEQRTRGETLTAEAPALLEKLQISPFIREKLEGLSVRDAGQPAQGAPAPPAYRPGSGSWQPGDPIPYQSRQESNAAGGFPRGNTNESQNAE